MCPYSSTCRYSPDGDYIVAGSFATKQGDAQDTCCKGEGERRINDNKIKRK